MIKQRLKGNRCEFNICWVTCYSLFNMVFFINWCQTPTTLWIQLSFQSPEVTPWLPVGGEKKKLVGGLNIRHWNVWGMVLPTPGDGLGIHFFMFFNDIIYYFCIFDLYFENFYYHLLYIPAVLEKVGDRHCCIWEPLNPFFYLFSLIFTWGSTK